MRTSLGELRESLGEDIVVLRHNTQDVAVGTLAEVPVSEEAGGSNLGSRISHWSLILIDWSLEANLQEVGIRAATS